MSNHPEYTGESDTIVSNLGADNTPVAVEDDSTYRTDCAFVGKCHTMDVAGCSDYCDEFMTQEDVIINQKLAVIGHCDCGWNGDGLCPDCQKVAGTLDVSEDGIIANQKPVAVEGCEAQQMIVIPDIYCAVCQELIPGGIIESRWYGKGGVGNAIDICPPCYEWLNGLPSPKPKAAKKPRKAKAKTPTAHQLLFGAISEALPGDSNKRTKADKSVIGKAVKQLLEVDAKPEEMKMLFYYCNKRYDNPGAMCMAKYYSAFTESDEYQHLQAALAHPPEAVPEQPAEDQDEPSEEDKAKAAALLKELMER
jgi:hypothetical protein